MEVFFKQWDKYSSLSCFIEANITKNIVLIKYLQYMFNTDEFYKSLFVSTSETKMNK